MAPLYRWLGRVLVGLVALVVADVVHADEILFLNGDRLTGKIVGAAGGKLTIKTDAAGEITIDLAKVKTFSTDDPILLKTGDATLRSKITGGPDGSVQVVPVPGGTPQTVPIKDVAQINPPPVTWTGSLVANALVTRGNSETESFGGSFHAVRRTEKDRLTLAAAYNYGREKDNDTGEKTTTINNVFGFAKYDYFLTEKLYLFGAVRGEHDEIADLNFRFTPSLGVGYQWFESPNFNLFTEAGAAWVYEDYKNDGTKEHFAARLAYHVDYKPHKALTLFHNLEYLPSFSDPGDDYNLNLDAGLRAAIIGSFFAEVKFELRYDSSPAPGAKKEDLRYILGVGWTF